MLEIRSNVNSSFLALGKLVNK